MNQPIQPEEKSNPKNEILKLYLDCKKLNPEVIPEEVIPEEDISTPLEEIKNSVIRAFAL